MRMKEGRGGRRNVGCGCSSEQKRNYGGQVMKENLKKEKLRWQTAKKVGQRKNFQIGKGVKSIRAEEKKSGSFAVWECVVGLKAKDAVRGEPWRNR